MRKLRFWGLFWLTFSVLIQGCSLEEELSITMPSTEITLSLSSTQNFSMNRYSGQDFSFSPTFQVLLNSEVYQKRNSSINLSAHQNSSCTSAAAGTLTTSSSNPLTLSQGIAQFSAVNFTSATPNEPLIYLLAQDSTNTNIKSCVGPIQILQKFNSTLGYAVFDENGVGIFPGTAGQYREDYVEHISENSDGTINVISISGYGNTTGEKSRISNVRYHANGALDSAFGTNGVVSYNVGTASFGGGTGVAGGRGDNITDGCKDSEGRTIIVGQTIESGGGYSALAARVLTNGQLDSSFGTNGVSIYNLGGVGFTGRPANTKVESFYKCIVLSNQKILLIGVARNSANGYEPLAVRLTASGTLDTSFNTVGYKLISAGAPGVTGRSNATKFDYFSIGRELEDGKYFLVGWSQKPGGGNQIFFLRMDSDGDIDTSFDTTGTKLLVHNGGSIAGATGAAQFETSEDIVIDGNSFYMSGASNGVQNRNQGYVCKMNLTDASLDLSFNSTGCFVLHNNTNGFYGAAAGFYGEYYSSVTLDSSNRLVVAGGGDDDILGAYYGYVTRLNSSGTPDTSFDSDGHFVSTLGDWYLKMILDSKGRYVIGGERLDSNGNWPAAVWRVLPSGILDL